MTAAQGPPVRILVVDDEPEIREMLDVVLTKEGWAVDQASSGAAALERARTRPYDVVVLDQRMPGLTGLQTARRLADENHPAAIVLFSAYLSPRLHFECDELGIVAVDKMDWQELVGRCAAFERKPQDARFIRASV